MKFKNIIIGFIFISIIMSFGNITLYKPAVSITGKHTIANTVYIKETLVADSVMINVVLVDNINIVRSYAEIEQEINLMVTHIENKNNVLEYAEKPYKISKRGKAFIKKYEQCRLNRYLLKGEKLFTIGWGHQIKPGEKIGKHISQEKADEIFENDCLDINNSANRLLNKIDPSIKVTQNFIDGLCSLIFNCGETGVSRTNFYKRLCNVRVNKHGEINIKDLEYALAAVKTANISWPGHKPRRKEEYKLMSKK